jgi:hypothetical protein
MIVLFDRLAYIERLTRAGISEEHARAYTEALEEALRSMAVKTDRDVMTALGRIESKLDKQEMRRKAFWTANTLGPMLFFVAAFGLMLVVLLN